MNTPKLKFFLVVLLFLAQIPLIQDLKAVNDTNDTLQEIYDRGYLLIGSDATYPPFEQINRSTNLVEGFDIDLAHQVAIALGVGLKVKTSAWDPIIPNLQANQFDVIISAMPITEEREEHIDFTRWYYKFHQAILVEAGNPLGIWAETDLNATITIGVESGTISDNWAQEYLNDSVTLYTFDNIFLAIAALKQGSVDVVLGDYPILARDEQESGQTKVVDIFASKDLGFACRTGDDNLRNALNDVLDTLLGSDESNPNPTDLYNTIYYKWFGVSAWDIGYFGSVTDAEISYVWFEDPTTTRKSTTIPKISPAFSLFPFLYLIPIAVNYRKNLKRN